jgi:hypothetical protein
LRRLDEFQKRGEKCLESIPNLSAEDFKVDNIMNEVGSNNVDEE